MFKRETLVKVLETGEVGKVVNVDTRPECGGTQIDYFVQLGKKQFAWFPSYELVEVGQQD